MPVNKNIDDMMFTIVQFHKAVVDSHKAMIKVQAMSAKYLNQVYSAVEYGPVDDGFDEVDENYGGSDGE